MGVFVEVTDKCERCGAEAMARAELLPDGRLQPVSPIPADASDRHWTVICVPRGAPTEKDPMPRHWRAYCDRVRCHEAYLEAVKREDDRAAEVAP